MYYCHVGQFENQYNDNKYYAKYIFVNKIRNYIGILHSYLFSLRTFLQS